MIRMIHVAKSQGKEIDFSPRFQTYFENKVGLNDLQIQVVKGIAKRVARKLWKWLKDENYSYIKGPIRAK